jgi:hypothetical protein
MEMLNFRHIADCARSELCKVDHPSADDGGWLSEASAILLVASSECTERRSVRIMLRRVIVILLQEQVGNVLQHEL